MERVLLKHAISSISCKYVIMEDCPFVNLQSADIAKILAQQFQMKLSFKLLGSLYLTMNDFSK